MIRFATVLQTQWDWRAAGNFLFGGAGSALLVLNAIGPLAGAAPSPWPVLLALALVGAGLGCVWLEIGRPWRALNVFRHPQRSWMTREGLVAMLVFGLGLAAVATGAVLLHVGAGIAGFAFLYCQARILRAAKGVPAWREPSIVPLILSTGLAEGSSLLALMALGSGAPPTWLPWSLATLALLRAAAWRRYRARIEASQVPAASRARLARFDLPLGAGGVAAAVLAIAAAFAPPVAAAMLLALAGLAALVPGWVMKLTLVTRASHLQGYAFGRLRRGHPLTSSRNPVHPH